MQHFHTSCSILIVEDHSIVALALLDLIEKLGCRAIGPVVRGEEAIRAAEEWRPDLVLMNIELKGSMDGIETAAEIKARFGISSVFFSGFNDPETRSRAEKAEPLAFIGKGTSLSRVAGILREELMRNRPTRA